MVKILIALAVFISTNAFAKNQEIRDFHFATCNGTRCMEVWSATGEMSQLQFAFTTQASTRVRIFDDSTKLDSNFEGLSSSYMPTLHSLILNKTNGESLVISMDDFKVESFSGKARK